MYLEQPILWHAGHFSEAYLKCIFFSLSFFQRQFLNAGKHVLVEYPMTLSWAAAQDLWKLAEQKGDVCSVCRTQTLF